MSAIEVDDVTKSFGDVVAVNGVSFRVEPGEVYGLLGHNGAGKTTVVEILEGHLTPDAGRVSVLGFTPSEHQRSFRDRIGVVLQATAVDGYLTVRETLQTFAAVYSRSRPVAETIDMIGLSAKADDQVRSLSGGQQRRLDLGVGIIGRPEVLFLDEPTTGFDPVARRQAWELIEQLCDDGMAVLLTTHYLEEAERLADRVGVLSQGSLVAEGSPSDLISTAPTIVTFRIPVGVSATAFDLPTTATLEADRVTIATDRPTAMLAAITADAVAIGAELDDLSVRRPTLEDIYFDIERRHAGPATSVERTAQ